MGIGAIDSYQDLPRLASSLWTATLWDETKRSWRVASHKSGGARVAGLPMWDDDEELLFVCFFVGFEWFRAPGSWAESSCPGGRWKLGSDGGHLHRSQSQRICGTNVGRIFDQKTPSRRTEIFFRSCYEIRPKNMSCHIMHSLFEILSSFRKMLVKSWDGTLAV